MSWVFVLGAWIARAPCNPCIYATAGGNLGDNYIRFLLQHCPLLTPFY